MHTAYAVRLYNSGGSDQLITGVSRQNVSTGSEVSRDESAGERYVRHASVVQQNPTANFATRAIATALGIVGAQGVTVDAGTTEPGLQFVQVSIDDDTGAPLAGSVHRTITMAKGFLWPDTLSVAQDEHAELSLQALALYDGTNNPLVPAASAALPGTMADGERFGLGAVSIGGVTVTDHLSIDLTFGLQVEARRAEGDIWPTHLLLVSVKPQLRVRGAGVGQFATSGGIPLAGVAATHANTAIYLRKRSTAVAGYLSGSNHIELTMAGLATWGNVHDATGNQTAELELMVDVVYDGTNAPIVVDTAAALP